MKVYPERTGLIADMVKVDVAEVFVTLVVDGAPEPPFAL